MFTIVVYDKETKVVLALLPFKISGDVVIDLPYGAIQHNEVEFVIFNEWVPMFTENENGDICFDENIFMIPNGTRSLN